jgi:hypothetical protein
MSLLSEIFNPSVTFIVTATSLGITGMVLREAWVSYQDRLKSLDDIRPDNSAFEHTYRRQYLSY